MTPIHITIEQQRDGKVVVRTNDQAPKVGRVVTPAQVLAMELLRTCGKQADVVEFEAAAQVVEPTTPLHSFARRFLHPEDLGYTVTPVVRDAARTALGMPPVETKGAGR